MPAGRIKEKLLGDALKVTLRAAGNTDDKVHSTKLLHRNSLQKEPTLLRNIYNSEVICCLHGFTSVFTLCPMELIYLGDKL